MSQRGLSTAGEDNQTEQNCRHNTGEKHPAPARGCIPRFVAHALNEHVDEDGGKYSDYDPELVESYAAAANPRGSYLGNIIRRNHGCRTDAHSADQTPENKLMQIRGKDHSN